MIPDWATDVKEAFDKIPDDATEISEDELMQAFEEDMAERERVKKEEEAEKAKKITEGLHCPNCGAPANTEVCPFCGTRTGIDSYDAYDEYPTYEVTEAHANPAGSMIKGILGFIVFMPTLMMTLEIILGGVKGGTAAGGIVLVIPLWGLLGYICYSFIKKELDLRKVKKYGHYTIGIVVGYVNDSLFVGGSEDCTYYGSGGRRYYQKAKIHISDENGSRNILYQVFSPGKPFPVNSKVRVRYIDDVYYICKMV